MLATLQKCKVCGKDFLDPKHPYKMMCSRKCAGVAKQLPVKKCPRCGKIFKPRATIIQYCSLKCARPAFGWSKGLIQTKITKKCEVCGNKFETVPSSSHQHCCSRKCSGIQRRKWPQKINCKLCFKEFLANRPNNFYCSRLCGNKERIKIIREKTPIPRSINHKTRPKLKELLGNKCMICKWDKEIGILEIHHKDRNRFNNNFLNLVLLCPNCHSLDHFKAKDGNYGFKSKKT